MWERVGRGYRPARFYMEITVFQGQEPLLHI